MKVKFKNELLLLAILVLACVSCQKVISVNLNNAAPQLVIEGNLTDFYGEQYVQLSKSVPFTSTNNYPPVTGATVIITDSIGNQYPLTEKSPGLYHADPLGGVYGMTYTLTVVTGGKTYTASSTMPAPVGLDSITEATNQFSTSNTRTIIVNYQDPPKVTNQYKFNMYVNRQLVNYIFTNNDSFSNGRYVREQLFEDATNINSGDTVGIEMQCIDKNIYQYWFSLSQLQNNGPGGGITPSNPPSNFNNNNVLGYFSAHTSDFKILIVR